MHISFFCPTDRVDGVLARLHLPEGTPIDRICTYDWILSDPEWRPEHFEESDDRRAERERYLKESYVTLTVRSWSHEQRTTLELALVEIGSPELSIGWDASPDELKRMKDHYMVLPAPEDT